MYSRNVSFQPLFAILVRLSTESLPADFKSAFQVKASLRTSSLHKLLVGPAPTYSTHIQNNMAEINPSSLPASETNKPQVTGKVYIGFIDLEASADGSYFKFAMLPCMYRGPDEPVVIVGGCSFYWKVSTRAPPRDAMCKETDNSSSSSSSWLVSAFFTMFEMLFPTVVASARQFRNEQVADPMRKVLAAYPGIRFVVRDSQVPTGVLNDILAAEQVPTITPIVLSVVREQYGVRPGPVNSRSRASVSLDTLDTRLEADFSQAHRLAQEFIDFTDPYIVAAALARQLCAIPDTK